MRKQYFFRPSERGLMAWDVDRLIALSANFSRESVPVESLLALDEPWSGDGEVQTWRDMIQHIRLIEEADLAFPIIISATGEVMDGRHRIAKAALANRSHIDAVRFIVDPDPDHVGRRPEDLPY